MDKEPPFCLATCFKEYAELTRQSRTLEAIDAYYDPDITQWENGDAPIVGQAVLRSREEAGLARISSLQIGLANVVIDAEKKQVWGEMTIVYDSHVEGRKKLAEAFFQQWRAGKIIEQKFYYRGIENER